MENSLNSSVLDIGYSNNAIPELNVGEQKQRKTPTTHNQICRFCGAAFTRRGSMIRHVRDQHEMNGRKSANRDHICCFCAAGFTTQTNLTHHVRAQHDRSYRRYKGKMLESFSIEIRSTDDP